jgi:hypothetical protein
VIEIKPLAKTIPVLQPTPDVRTASHAQMKGDNDDPPYQGAGDLASVKSASVSMPAAQRTTSKGGKAQCDSVQMQKLGPTDGTTADTEAPPVMPKGGASPAASVPVPYSSFSQGMKLFIISLLAVAGICTCPLPLSLSLFVCVIHQ